MLELIRRSFVGLLCWCVLGLPCLRAVAQPLASDCVLPEEMAGGAMGIYGGSWGRDSGSPGALLGCRTIQPESLGSALMPLAQRAILIRYVTTNAAERREPATALILVPNSVAEESSGRAPLIALATGTAGVSDSCAPSRTLRSGTSLIEASAQRYLSRGFTVLVVDYLGLGTQLGALADGDDHPYLEGPSAAHVILDGLRAARNTPGARYLAGQPDATIPDAWQVAVDGYSQGGAAALWATLAAPEYAPELPLAASVVGAPPVDLRATIDQVEHSVFRSLFAFFLIGIESATDPATAGIDVQRYLTPTGRALVSAARVTCSVDLGVATALDVLFGGLRIDDLVDTEGLFSDPQVLEHLRRNSLIDDGYPRFDAPVTPVLGYHGALDGVAPYSAHRALMVLGWGATEGSATLTGDAAIPREALVFQPALFGAHSTTSSLVRNDSAAWLRYTPFEWLWDGLFSRSRSLPDLQ